MPLKVYKMDASPPARAVMMLCDILDIPVELVEVDIVHKKQFTPEFLKINPLHTVPVFEDGDFILHESHAIMAYLTDTYAKDDSLYPKDVKKRALVNQKLLFNAATLFPRMRSITFEAVVKGNPNVRDTQLSDVEECYSFLETFLSKNKYLAADHMTLADIASISTVTTLLYIIPLDDKKYPKTRAWIDNLEKQSFCVKYNKPGNTFLGEALKKALNK
ncbi:glutathione S-transferase 1-like [Epargyreus clarus]|uniref:glutathione S-transferase 1-like n=1 Tax=Epargyreus clarus TaxID=520877 RepID=UPI003C2FB2E1